MDYRPDNLNRFVYISSVWVQIKLCLSTRWSHGTLLVVESVFVPYCQCSSCSKTQKPISNAFIPACSEHKKEAPVHGPPISSISQPPVPFTSFIVSQQPALLLKTCSSKRYQTNLSAMIIQIHNHRLVLVILVIGQVIVSPPILAILLSLDIIRP